MTRARPIRPDIATSAGFVALIAGLAVAVAITSAHGPDPALGGGLFVFCNKRGDRRMAVRRGAPIGDPDRHPRGLDRRDREPRVQGRDDRV